MYTWIHIARELRKELFRHRSNFSSSSNTLRFLSFQIVQKMYNGAALQAFLCFLPTKWPCHPKEVSLTEVEKTYGMSNKENTNNHKVLALAQWIRIWSMNSASSLQRTHLLTKDKLPKQKKFTLDGIQEFLIILKKDATI